jgi:hypothetical protein
MASLIRPLSETGRQIKRTFYKIPCIIIAIYYHTMHFHHRSLQLCRNRCKKATLMAEISFQFSDVVGASSISNLRYPQGKVWSCQFWENLPTKARRQTRNYAIWYFNVFQRFLATELQNVTYTILSIIYIAIWCNESPKPGNLWSLRQNGGFFYGATVPSGPGLPHYRRFTITLGHTTLLWSSDQPDTETSTWQLTTLTTDRHPGLPWDPKPQAKQVSGHRYRQNVNFKFVGHPVLRIDRPKRLHVWISQALKVQASRQTARRIATINDTLLWLRTCM